MLTSLVDLTDWTGRLHGGRSNLRPNPDSNRDREQDDWPMGPESFMVARCAVAAAADSPSQIYGVIFPIFLFDVDRYGTNFQLTLWYCLSTSFFLRRLLHADSSSRIVGSYFNDRGVDGDERGGGERGG